MFRRFLNKHLQERVNYKKFSKIEDFLDVIFSNLVYIRTRQLKDLVNKLAVKEFSC